MSEENLDLDAISPSDDDIIAQEDEIDIQELQKKKRILSGLGKDGKNHDVRHAIDELCSDELLSRKEEIQLARRIHEVRQQFVAVLQECALFPRVCGVDKKSDPIANFQYYEDLKLLLQPAKGDASSQSSSQFFPEGSYDEAAKHMQKVDKLYERYKNFRDEMIMRNQRLVVFIAKRYRGLGLDFLDLIGEGNKGLIRAADRYDYERGFQFATYAFWWVRKSIKQALTDDSRAIRLPSHIVDLLYKMRCLEQRYIQEEGVKPPLKVLADAFNISIAEIERLRLIRKRLARLDTSSSDESDDFTLHKVLEDTSAQPVDETLHQQDVFAGIQKVKEFVCALPKKLKIREIEVEAYLWAMGLQDDIRRTPKQVAKILEDAKSGGRMTAAKVDGYVKKIQRIVIQDPELLKILSSEE